MQGRDHFQQIDHYSHRQHARLGTSRDINASDIKIFIAHLLVMSSVHKTALHNYWSTTTLSHTLFLVSILGEISFKIYCGIYTFATLQTTQLLDPQIMTLLQKCDHYLKCVNVISIYVTHLALLFHWTNLGWHLRGE